MIISKTPLRISFIGGGTDLPSHYLKHNGAVISTSINKYIYITVNEYSNLHPTSIFLKYSKTEAVDSVEDIKHPLIRECLKLTKVTSNVEITSMADVPGGTGLGSSSAYTVGLLRALYAFKGQHVSSTKIAEQACKIEIDILKEPIGKQDQFAVATGNFNLIKFNKNDSVEAEPVIFPKFFKKILQDSLMMFYTGGTRSASAILETQNSKNDKNSDKLIKMQELTNLFLDKINFCDIRGVGELLHENWLLKKSLVEGISNDYIGSLYNEARKAGAIGGKICGAGGSGFLLLIVPSEEVKNKIREKLKLTELLFKFENRGVHIIYSD